MLLRNTKYILIELYGMPRYTNTKLNIVECVSIKRGERVVLNQCQLHKLFINSDYSRPVLTDNFYLILLIGYVLADFIYHITPTSCRHTK